MSNSDILIYQLDSESAWQRLRAARNILKNPSIEHLPALKIKFHQEEVPWVKEALARIIYKLEGGKKEINLTDSNTSSENETFTHRQSIVSDTIGKVLHELQPAVGMLKLSMMKELNDEQLSILNSKISNIDRLLDLFEQWRRVQNKAKTEEVDIYETIKELISESKSEQDFDFDILVANDEIIFFKTDKFQLKIILINALRNAIQAVKSAKQKDIRKQDIVINYGETDKVYWVSILDEGVGPPSDSEYLFKSTMTTKPGHMGLGLPISMDAAERINASLSLTPGTERGAKFILEIYKRINE